MNGVVLYEGPSLLGPGDIVFLVTGFQNSSSNSGTGPMLQGWILNRDIHPVDAIRNGDNVAICGDCPLRFQFGRSNGCYATLMAPSTIWKGYRAGKYGRLVSRLPPRLYTQPLRVGAYGDPAAIPASFWDPFFQQLVKNKARWTGFTGQWTREDAQNLRSYLHASVRTAKERAEAKLRGWKTYRIRLPGDPVLVGEAVCPKSAEAGKKKTCYDCLRCRGDRSRAPDPVIIAHGSRVTSFHAERVLQQIKEAG